MNEILVRIRFLLPSLPRAEKLVAQALIENPEAVLRFTLADLARETGSSDASIIRFCRRMGYNGYTELKQAIIAAIADGDEIFAEEVSKDDSMKEILKKVFQSNIQTLTDTLSLASDNYQLALKAFLEAKSIHFFGVGDAAAACQLAYMKFARLGIPGSAHSDVMLQMMAAGSLGVGDIAFAVSYEGRSRTIVDAMAIAKSLGATTICITKMNKSPLLKVTDIPLFTAVSDLTVGRDRVTRRVADQAIMDALYLGVLTKSGKDFSKYIKKQQKAIDFNKMKSNETRATYL